METNLLGTSIKPVVLIKNKFRHQNVFLRSRPSILEDRLTVLMNMIRLGLHLFSLEEGC